MTWHPPKTWISGDVQLTGSILNYELRDELNALYDLLQALYDELATDWTNATYESGWTDYSGSEAPAGYRKIGSQVYLRGIVTSSNAPPDTIFILPSGFRPSSSVRAIAASDVGPVEVWVNLAGGVRFVSDPSGLWPSGGP